MFSPSMKENSTMPVIPFKKIKAFCMGIVEFRADLTTSYADYSDLCTYDTGREFAHRVTFRKFER
jgi:hypothetical protein